MNSISKKQFAQDFWIHLQNVMTPLFKSVGIKSQSTQKQEAFGTGL